MYRKIFISLEGDIQISIPRNWYGRNVEVIAFPVAEEQIEKIPPRKVSEARKKREEMNRRYSMDLSNFKFNRDEANNYEE